MAGAAPWALATTRRGSCGAAAGLAQAARTTAALHVKIPPCEDGPTVATKYFKLVLAGTAMGALISSEAECAPRKKPNGPDNDSEQDISNWGGA